MYINLFYFFLLVLTNCRCVQMAGGWEYLNIHCRDNENDPVDWWYIYKTPSDLGRYMESGINFSYITPEDARRWKSSRKHIFGTNMLQHTLAPLFKLEYEKDIAVMVYEGRAPSYDFKGSAAYGVMISNDMGGVWIGHTVPGFPDLINGPTFPSNEIRKGHMLMCLTLDVPTLNSMSIAIKQSGANVVKISVPRRMSASLPDWNKMHEPVPETLKPSKTSVKKTKVLNFVTRDKSLHGMILARSPGDSRCVYKSFAKTKSIVMDVYGHREHKNVICDKKFSVRNINSISLKFPEQQVYYISNRSDSMGFAVSTAAEWQRHGSTNNMDQHWTCTGNIENQPITASGGIIACVNNYSVWLAFDNLKVKEPDCT